MPVSGREASGRKGLRLVSGSGGRVPGVVHALVEGVERVHVGGVELDRVVETPAAGERAVRLELDAALSADDDIPF